MIPNIEFYSSNKSTHNIVIFSNLCLIFFIDIEGKPTNTFLLKHSSDVCYDLQSSNQVP